MKKNNQKNILWESKKQQFFLEKRRYDLPETMTFVEKWKLKRNVPINKIIGYIEMANVKIDISKKVLVPRYETEELIELASKLIHNQNYKSVLDLCCGSGFIGIALKKNFKNLNVTQTDIDPKAIKQTKINLLINNLETQVLKSNMFDNLNQKFDVIISNPPYLPESDKKNLDLSILKYEPHHALFAKNGGLYFYYEIEKNLNKFLNDKGLVILEINPLHVGWFLKNKFVVVKDINQKDRFAYKFLD